MRFGRSFLDRAFWAFRNERFNNGNYLDTIAMIFHEQALKKGKLSGNPKQILSTL